MIQNLVVYKYLFLFREKPPNISSLTEINKELKNGWVPIREIPSEDIALSVVLLSKEFENNDDYEKYINSKPGEN